MKKLGCTSSEQQIFNAKMLKKNHENPNEKVKDKMGKLFKFMDKFCFCQLGMWIVQFIRPCFRLYYFSVELLFQWEMYKIKLLLFWLLQMIFLCICEEKKVISYYKYPYIYLYVYVSTWMIAKKFCY